MFTKSFLFLSSMIAVLITQAWVTLSGSQVVVETTDVTKATDAVGAYLGSWFELIKFLPVIAVLAGWSLILSYFMWILPWWRKKNG